MILDQKPIRTFLSVVHSVRRNRDFKMSTSTISHTHLHARIRRLRHIGIPTYLHKRTLKRTHAYSLSIFLSICYKEMNELYTISLSPCLDTHTLSHYPLYVVTICYTEAHTGPHRDNTNFHSHNIGTHTHTLSYITYLLSVRTYTTRVVGKNVQMKHRWEERTNQYVAHRVRCITVESYVV